MNEDNLVYGDRLSQKKAREYGKKGGLTKAANARKRKELQMMWLALLSMEDSSGMTNQERINKGLVERAVDGDPNAYEKIMEYSGLSVRQELKEKELDLKREELKLKKQQQAQPDAADTAADAWSGVLGQIRAVMEDGDEGSADS